MTCKNCTKIKKSYIFIQPTFTPYNPIFARHFLDTNYCCCEQGLINKCEDCKKKNKDSTKEDYDECQDECCLCNIM